MAYVVWPRDAEVFVKSIVRLLLSGQERSGRSKLTCERVMCMFG